jgi:hypothetical protein
VRLRISDGSRELERLNFEVRLEEFIFKSASRLSMTILDPPIATLVANFQSRVLNPDAFITTRRDRLYWEAPSDRSSPISRPTGAADLIDAKISLSRGSQSFHRSWSKFVQAAVQISVRMEFLVGTARRIDQISTADAPRLAQHLRLPDTCAVISFTVVEQRLVEERDIAGRCHQAPAGKSISRSFGSFISSTASSLMDSRLACGGVTPSVVSRKYLERTRRP